MAYLFAWILAILFDLGATVISEHDDVFTNVTPASADIEVDWAQD